MKRMITWMLLAAFALQLAGCYSASEDDAAGATFYYVRSAYQYHSGENVVVGEVRTSGAETSDIAQLVELYLNGPVTEGLVCPFPKDTQLISLLDHTGLLEMTLSDTVSALSDAQFSLACVCLGKTVLENTDIILVTFISGERSMTVSRDNYLTTDDVGTNEATKEAKS